MKEQDFRTIVIAWLIALTMVWVCVLLFWRPICEHAALTVVKSAVGEVGPLGHAARPERERDYAEQNRRSLEEWGKKIERESQEALDKVLSKDANAVKR